MKRIVGYLLRRLASAALTLLLLSLIAFAMVKVIPGDEAHVAAGVTATPQQVAAMRVYLGLDKPWPVQYLSFLGHALHGDLGTSISSHTSIATGIRQVLPQTIQLVIVALLIMVVIAVPAAIASALRRSRAIGRGGPGRGGRRLGAADLLASPGRPAAAGHRPGAVPHLRRVRPARRPCPRGPACRWSTRCSRAAPPSSASGLYHLILPAPCWRCPSPRSSTGRCAPRSSRCSTASTSTRPGPRACPPRRLIAAPRAAQRRRPGHHHPRRHRRHDDRVRDPGRVRLRAQRNRRLPHQRRQQLRPLRRHRRRARDRRHHRRDQLPGRHHPAGPRPPAPRPGGGEADMALLVPGCRPRGSNLRGRAGRRPVARPDRRSRSSCSRSWWRSSAR